MAEPERLLAPQVEASEGGEELKGEVLVLVGSEGGARCWWRGGASPAWPLGIPASV